VSSDRNANFRKLFGLVLNITISAMIIVGISFQGISMGKLSPLMASSGLVSVDNSSSRNITNLHGVQSSSSNLYFAPPPPSSNLVNNGINKVIMIGFDDSYRSQILYAKPILDKYGFKASFFEVCTWIGKTKERQTWQDISALERDGMDIESHTMTHAHLPTLLSSPSQLDYEIGGSKKCLASHGINATIFGYPLNLGSNNPKIVNVVAKYYNLARSGSAPLMFLNCTGYPKDIQTDCRNYLESGKLTQVNRYDVKSDSFRHVDSYHNYSPSEEFQKFVQRVNSQIRYNINGKINAIPIITYHNLTNSMQDYNNMASTITIDLFAQEMRYLHDNGFTVLLLNQLSYDPNNKVFVLRNVSLCT
jgi:hypothetical protein